MRFLALSLVVFLFVVLPLLLLNTLVLPELNGLSQAYARQDETVRQLFPQP